VWQFEKDDAKKHKRAIKIEISPPDVKGLTTGTTFKPGPWANAPMRVSYFGL